MFLSVYVFFWRKISQTYINQHVIMSRWLFVAYFVCWCTIDIILFIALLFSSICICLFKIHVALVWRHICSVFVVILLTEPSLVYHFAVLLTKGETMWRFHCSPKYLATSIKRSQDLVLRTANNQVRSDSENREKIAFFLRGKSDILKIRRKGLKFALLCFQAEWTVRIKFGLNPELWSLVQEQISF